MSLRQQALGLLLVVAAILAWVALVVERAMDDVGEQRAYATGTLRPGQDLSLDTLTEAVHQENGARGFVLTGDPAFLEPYEEGREAVRSDLQALTALFRDDPTTLALIDDVRSDFDAWSDRSRNEVRAAVEGDLRLARQLVARGEGKAAFDRLRASGTAMQDHIRDELVAQQALTDEAFQQLRVTFWTAVSVLVALLLLTVVLLRQWVLLPVERLRHGMRAVADGQLSSPVRAGGPAEVAALGHDAEAMRRRIVTELDNARAAAEALDQEGPAAAGLMRELRTVSSETLRGVDVHGEVRPARGLLAGDWWDAVPMPGGATAIVVGDVAGHGPEAGVVAARFKQRLSVLLSAHGDLAEAFADAAEGLDPDAERFLSCVVAVVDPSWRRLRWLNAGHPGALLLRGSGSELVAQTLRPTGPIVGLPDSRWDVEETWIGVDDVLLLMTDGVTAARDASGRELGVEGVVDALRGSGAREPSVLVADVVETVRRFSGDARRDDATCVALRPQGGLDRSPVGRAVRG